LKFQRLCKFCVFGLNTSALYYFAGAPLKIFLGLIESRLFSNLIVSTLHRRNNFPQILAEKNYTCQPLFKPDTSDTGGYQRETRHNQACIPQDADGCTTATAAVIALGLDKLQHSSPCAVLELHALYLSKTITPSDIAEALIEAIEESETMSPPLRAFIQVLPENIRAAAAESTARYAAGTPLSILDGVTFGVKDLLDVEGYQTTAGTSFLGSTRPVAGTIPGVIALVDAGAILAGKLNTHELGLGCTGLNPIHGTPRNPFNVDYHTGGSSSGSAAAIAAGLVAFAVCTDGGGSVRMPSSLCGLVGLKPTYQRVFTIPSFSITHTISSCSPMASTVRDCALLYAMLSNKGHSDASSIPLPLALPNLATPTTSALGLTAGIHWAWFEHAQPEVVATCKQAVELLKNAGLAIKPIVIPHLNELRTAHSGIIVGETRSNIAEFISIPALRKQLTAETRVTLAIGDGFSAGMYVNAQKVRRRFDDAVRHIFKSEQIDFIITPTTPMVAPRIRPKSLVGGISDVSTTVSLMQFCQLANLIGIPAISVPVGRASSIHTDTSSPPGSEVQLPVGLQIMAPPWHEASLLHIADILESQLGPHAGMKPQVHWNLIEKAKQLHAANANANVDIQNGN
jgi:Asp-tRNA(Asn)/Glu-tRNA(Gln) amidotransferase A subunit family amidase